MAHIENDGFVFLTCVGFFFVCVFMCASSLNSQRSQTFLWLSVWTKDWTMMQWIITDRQANNDKNQGKRALPTDNRSGKVGMCREWMGLGITELSWFFSKTRKKHFFVMQLQTIFFLIYEVLCVTDKTKNLSQRLHDLQCNGHLWISRLHPVRSSLPSVYDWVC